MRYLLFFLFGSLALAPCSKADSVITITQAVVSIGRNFGDGDNVFSTMSGRPNASFVGQGGSQCDFCFVGQILLPGESVSASMSYIELFSFVDSAHLGGKSYNNTQITFGSSEITSGIITFPSGRLLPPSFRVTLPASMADFYCTLEQTGQLFTVDVPSGKLELDFQLVPAQGGIPAYYEYESGEFVTTPEPDTVVLFGTGLLFVILLQTRLLRFRRQI